jgi:hypothetical protein
MRFLPRLKEVTLRDRQRSEYIMILRLRNDSKEYQDKWRSRFYRIHSIDYQEEFSAINLEEAGCRKTMNEMV